MKKYTFALFFLMIPASAFATLGAGATYYIDYNAGAGGDGSYANPYNTDANAFVNSGGNVYIIKNGTYTVQTATAPSGTATMPTMIKAETDSRVMITGGLQLLNGVAKYVDYYSIRWKNSNEKKVTGNNIRFFRCRFQNGAASGNNVKLAVGSGDYNYTHDVLLEDCRIWGLGGRYDQLIYNAYNVTNRRVIARKDGGSSQVSDPEANFTVYDSSNAVFLNTMVLDSTGSYSTMVGGYYQVDNNTTDIQLGRTHYLGTMCMNVKEYCHRIDANATNSSATWRNTLAWNGTLGGFGFGSGNNFTGTIHGFTVGASSPTSGTAFGEYGAASLSIKNGNMTGNSVDDFDGVSGTYFNSFNNGATATGLGSISSQSYSLGQTYLTRIEPDSFLYTKGENGAPMGAIIEKRIGVSGSMYTGTSGTGWDTTTSDDLWPWPDEAQIKVELCEDGQTKGICAAGHANRTLTQYVVGWHANWTSPYSACTGDTLSPSLSGVTSSSFTASWTNIGAINYLAVMDDNSDFSSPMSSGTLTSATSGYVNLSASTNYYFEVKVASQPDCAYSSTSGQTSAAGGGSPPPEGPPSNRTLDVHGNGFIRFGPGYIKTQ